MQHHFKIKVISSLILLMLTVFGFGLIQQVSCQSDNLEVLNYSWYFDNLGGLHVVGEVQNVGSTALNPVVIYGTIFSSDQTIQVQSYPCKVYVNYMLPQQKAPFLMDFRSADFSWLYQGEPVMDFGVVQANATEKYQYQNLEITSSTTSVDAEGAYWVTGTVKNTGDYVATNVRVIATFYNASNAIIATGYLTPPISLNPSGEGSFKVGAFDINQTAAFPGRVVTSYSLLIQTEGPLESGTLPSTPTEHTGSTSPTSSTPSNPSDSSSTADSNNNGSTNPLPLDIQQIAIIVVVIIVVIISALVFARRRSGKASRDRKTKSQAISKNKPSSRRR